MRKLVLGVGCKRHVSIEELEKALDEFLHRHGVERQELFMLASCDVKNNEPGLLKLACRLGVNIKFFPPTALCQVPIPNPSARVREKIGSPSVAEAASLLAGKGQLIVPKQKFITITFALATCKLENQESNLNG
ncbi:MAG: cobalamin biosynthesis protein [Pseudomonadota bacterium]|nr:cobalamin biosynthesis protein [Pseudomonadota bacterium]